jgi:peptidyl-prolyl cis-trans isomerase SurA
LKHVRFLMFLGLLTLTATSAFAQRLDGIAAVVNDEVVLQSDVEEQMYLFLLRSRIDPDSSQLDTLRHEVLEQLINEKVIVAEAKRLGLSVSATEVDKQVEQAIRDAKTRMGGEAGFREQLAKENLTEDKLREKYRTDMQRELLARRLVERALPRKKVTPVEAEAYFKAHPEKFPKLPAELRLSVIQIPALPDSAVDARAKAVVVAARKRVTAGGEKFAKVAAEVSDDPRSAQNGGDLGFFTRGTLDRALEETVFALKVGEISQPVRSPFGWHVIELMERDTLKTRSGRDSLAADGRPLIEVHARHIVERVELTEADLARAKTLADRVRDEAVRGADFGTLSRKYSHYEGARDENGDVGFVSLATLQPNIRTGVEKLQVGEISQVLPNQAGLNIFKVTDRKPEREYNLDEIRDDLPEAVENIQQRERYDEWIKGLRSKAVVEIRSS